MMNDMEILAYAVVLIMSGLWTNYHGRGLWAWLGIALWGSGLCVVVYKLFSALV